jgi:hypothetical protein
LTTWTSPSPCEATDAQMTPYRSPSDASSGTSTVTVASWVALAGSSTVGSLTDVHCVSSVSTPLSSPTNAPSSSRADPA